MSVLAYPARFLPRLPAPWRLRLRLGEATIDCTSSGRVEPSGWNRDETLYVLIAALEGRLGAMQAATSAAGRSRRKVTQAATWAQVSGGLNELHLTETRGSVGDALRAIGAELVGEWSGDAAEVPADAPTKPTKKRRRAA